MWEIIISGISLFVSISAIIVTCVIYWNNLQLNRKLTAYRLLFDINKYVIDYPKIRMKNVKKSQKSNEELEKDEQSQKSDYDLDIDEDFERKVAYQTIVWNFIEGAYRLDLTEDEYLKPAISSLAKENSNWFEPNREFFDENFIQYVDEVLLK